jgi:hypothetical protein
MKKILSILIFLFLAPINSSLAGEVYPVVLQLKYAPWGFVSADEPDGYFNDDNTEKFDMHFDRSYGGRLIVLPYYIAANHSIANIDADLPDAEVDTLSVGFGGSGSLNESSYYATGAVGVGRGYFKFKDPNLDTSEAFFEVNMELGKKIDFLMLGTGVDWQIFGSPGETKAYYLNLYIGTSISF